jgi:hypothetical protein
LTALKKEEKKNRRELEILNPILPSVKTYQFLAVRLMRSAGRGTL